MLRLVLNFSYLCKQLNQRNWKNVLQCACLQSIYVQIGLYSLFGFEAIKNNLFRKALENLSIGKALLS